jgi:hypothetical protein
VAAPVAPRAHSVCPLCAAVLKAGEEVSHLRDCLQKNRYPPPSKKLRVCSHCTFEYQSTGGAADDCPMCCVPDESGARPVDIASVDNSPVSSAEDIRISAELELVSDFILLNLPTRFVMRLTLPKYTLFVVVSSLFQFTFLPNVLIFNLVRHLQLPVRLSAARWRLEISLCTTKQPIEK